jgi:hypothetical protein
MALVAQGIEQRTSNPQVVGSIPTQGAQYKYKNYTKKYYEFKELS